MFGIGEILDIGPRVGRAAIAAGIIFEDRRTAAAAIARLRIEATDRATSRMRFEGFAIGVHAGPKSRQAAMKGVYATRQQAGVVGLETRPAAEREQRVDGTITGRG